MLKSLHIHCEFINSLAMMPLSVPLVSFEYLFLSGGRFNRLCYLFTNS